MSGYITSVNMHNGMYVTPQQELMEIVDEKHLHLELDIFEKRIVLNNNRPSYHLEVCSGIITGWDQEQVKN